MLKPIILTPTPDARERFMRAALAAGLTWGIGMNETKIQTAISRDWYSAAYLSIRDTNIYYFIDTVAELQLKLKSRRDYILVNSPRHFISAAKRKMT
jgi:hypothetical protein